MRPWKKFITATGKERERGLDGRAQWNQVPEGGDLKGFTGTDINFLFASLLCGGDRGSVCGSQLGGKAVEGGGEGGGPAAWQEVGLIRQSLQMLGRAALPRPRPRSLHLGREL